jgi:hypothetical protein
VDVLAIPDDADPGRCRVGRAHTDHRWRAEIEVPEQAG